MSHTQGKLNFYDDRQSTGRIEIVGIGKTVARIYLSVPGEDEANARRLVACWNACDGVSTAGVEAIAALGGITHKMTVTAALVKQRDELLEALRSCEPPHPACGETVGDCVRAGKCGCSLGAAINKAEGKS